MIGEEGIVVVMGMEKFVFDVVLNDGLLFLRLSEVDLEEMKGGFCVVGVFFILMGEVFVFEV